MAGHGSRFLDAIRQPEYTGENRCAPCTVLNVAIAAVASTVVAVAWIPLAGAVAFAGSLVAIYLRGYLVPGTPDLTKRYLPERVLSWFDTHPLEEDQDAAENWETIEKLEDERQNAVDPEQFLLEEDVIEPCEDGDDFCLTDGFADVVDRQIAERRDDPVDRGDLADLFDADPDDVSFQDREYPAIKIKHRIRKWPSDGALLADVATSRALYERTDRWADVPVEQRRRLLETLRGFLDHCPTCGGSIRYSDEVVESCCGQYGVTRIACVECGEHLLEFDPTKMGADEIVKGFTP